MPNRPFDFRPRTRILFGAGEFSRLGEVARELGGTRCLLVADRGMVQAGYVQEAKRALKARRMEFFGFHDFDANPTTAVIEAGRAFTASLEIDLIVGLGGGSSMDCAKGVNFVLTNGGTMRDYRGYGKASRPLLPMIGIPTTAGTGSEALTYALISDAETHTKMACGDPKAAFRAVLLDPYLTLTQPDAVTAAAGYDAISHAVETITCTRRTALSECFSREAWRLLSGNYERVIRDPRDLAARGAMLIGAHFAGMAIENSMLGATHACANPLTANYHIPHGVAVALMLSHVVSWNTPGAAREYHEFAADLPRRLRELAEIAGLPLTLREVSVPEEALPRLAEEASAQWSGRFNPRPFDAGAALELYQSAY